MAASTIARDVTARRLAENIMHESYDQLRRAEEIGKLGHWTWYIREDRVVWSDGLYQLFGLTPGEFGATYNAYIERVHPEDVNFVQQSVRTALQQTVPFEFESRIIRKDGEIRHLFTRAEVVMDTNGTPLRMTGVAVDSTERAEAEKALERISDDLRRCNAELEQFAYVASHDLQEPLRMISSFVQLLSQRYQGKLDQDADEFIAFAVDGAKRMQNLINDLLAYSRVGTHGNQFSSVSCESLLEEALTNLQVAIEESAAEISHDPMPVVHGDAAQLGTVFQNLLGNAIKFRAEEPPRIHVGVQPQDNEWVFSIHDNGIGIDPKFTERIFIIFQRLNERTAYPGTGIGLSICKRIILRHGGRIWVESEPDKGATFYFTIPMETSL